jgi:hypothetical protein
MRRLLELLAEANYVEYKDGKPVLLIDSKRRVKYTVKYSESGDPIEIVEEAY